MITPKRILPLFFILVLVMNVYLYMSGMQLSNQIHEYETHITQLKKDNLVLEQQRASMQSLSYAKQIAASMSFTKDATPLYIEQPHIAYSPKL